VVFAQAREKAEAEAEEEGDGEAGQEKLLGDDGR
jgi:hypothetical protein